MDSVDRHIEYWKRELPELDAQVEGVVTRMQMLVRHLQRRREAGLAAYGLKGWEYDVLWRLRAAGAPYRVTPTRLAEVLDTHPATLTRRLERLERSGYVVRSYDSADRRRLDVELTEQGHRAWEATIGGQAAAEHELLGPLEERERAQLDGLLRRLVGGVEGDGVELMPSP